MEMNPAEARAFWKALAANAAALVSDARLLTDAGSFGRARALTVLAQEELGKALWIYDTFTSAWSDGNDKPRTVEALRTHGRSHTRKYLEATMFSGDLRAFWGDYSLGLLDGESWEEADLRQAREAEEAAIAANLAKQAGFYVDRDDDGAIHSPTEIEAGSISDDLQLAARVIEMLLIRDHSRMKTEASTAYDSTHEQQLRLLPVAHPDEWDATVDQLRRLVEGRASEEQGHREPGQER